MRRLVLDASVLLAAPVGRPEGSPSLLIEAARSGAIEMIACDTLLAEFERGLGSRYFRDRVSEEERTLITAMLRGIATVLPDPLNPPAVVRDPADDYLVALARAAPADAIVTGDRDLLEHQGLQPPAITAHAACHNSDCSTHRPAAPPTRLGRRRSGWVSLRPPGALRNRQETI